MAAVLDSSPGIRSIEGGNTFSVLVLLLGDSLLSFQESLSVFIKLELSNSHVGGVDGDLGLLTYAKHSGQL